MTARRNSQPAYGQAITELAAIRPDLADAIDEHVTALRAEAAWNRAAARRASQGLEAAPTLQPMWPVPDPFTIPEKN